MNCKKHVYNNISGEYLVVNIDIRHTLLYIFLYMKLSGWSNRYI